LVPHKCLQAGDFFESFGVKLVWGFRRTVKGFSEILRVLGRDFPRLLLGSPQGGERRGAMKLMDNRKWSLGLAAMALGSVSLMQPVPAQNAAQNSGQPARAVRLSYVDGQVKLSQGGQVLADKAVANTPLFEGMQLATADSGKAEIQFEDGSVARISPDSSLTLATLRGSGTSAEATLQVNGGLAYFEFQGGSQAGQMNVHFGNTDVSTSGFTVLRVDMDNPPGQLAVFSGNAHVQGANNTAASALSADLHGGESITLNAADASQYDLAESIEPDSWDAWNSDRDETLTAEAANQTGAPANMGVNPNPEWNDLDASGNWYNVPGQGYVWSPYDAANAGFDPYGNGSWMWTPGFGYLWASGYPWGYLPFQCGAWNFYNGFGWGWAPGLGGCLPWWGLGFYGGPNIGYAPPGYRIIARPILPRRPLGGKPIALVAVNRRPEPLNPGLPQRDKTTMVSIAGKSVLPMATLPSRPVFPVTTFNSANHVQTAKSVAGQAGAARPGYVRPVTPNPSAAGFRQAQNSAGGIHNSQPARNYSAPSHGASAPAHASAPSGGGGFHSSGGAPSGGGGGSHGGGGGGGGGGHH
jgi:uncharacterized membrane protein YgcG